MNTHILHGVACLVLVLTGCGLAPSQPTAPEEVVAKRAQEFWDMVLQKQFEREYQMLAPAYRARMNYESYMSRQKLATYTDAKVLSVQCTKPKICEAEVQVTYTGVMGVRGAPKGTVVTVWPERWTEDEGTWYRYPPH